jgi:glycosyltransferase involved in cell wall biosynthesis
MSPHITVFIPVYNGQKHLAEAINSVLKQEYVNFELLILDDGSTDDTARIIKAYSDSRIRFIANEANLGISFSRNRAIAEARGEYLAFLDADDIALPHRLGKQLDYLERHPEIAACGSQALVIDESGQSTGTCIHVPVDPAEIKVRLAFQNVFVNSSMMFRLEALRSTEGYPDTLCEDYDIAVRLNSRFALGNLDHVLLHYRSHAASLSNIQNPAMRDGERRIIRSIHRSLGIQQNDAFVRMHQGLIMDPDARKVFGTSDYIHLLQALKNANERKALFPKLAFNRLLFILWYGLLIEKSEKDIIRLFFQNALFEWKFVHLRMLVKVLKRRFKAVTA